MNFYKYKYSLVVVIILCIPVQIVAQLNWEQKGYDIQGSTAMEKTGSSVCVSGDGMSMVIGSHTAPVKVMQLTGNYWQQKGPGILPEVANDYKNSVVTMSDDGNVIAIGAPANDQVGVNSGHVRVYSWDGNTWVQKGNDIDGMAAGDLFGESISLNGDGSVLAVGASGNDQAGAGAGQVKIFSWDGNAWVLLGSPINGTAAGDLLKSVSLNYDGLRVAVGSVGYTTNPNQHGLLQVFYWNGSQWQIMGSPIAGYNYAYNLGAVVTLSDDGTRLASNYTSYTWEYVFVSQWNGASWVNMSGISPQTIHDNTGSSLSFSGNGSRLAVGSNCSDPNGDASGRVRVFEWDANTWNLIGDELDGDFAGDSMGHAANLNTDGTRLAIGALNNDVNGNNSGLVRYFHYTYPVPCQTNVILASTPYITTLTKSDNWILTFGEVVVPNNYSVKLDADEAGFVKLFPGFTAEYGSVFIAQALDGCGPGIPDLPQNNEGNEFSSYLEEEILLSVYPNPASGNLQIRQTGTREMIFLFDIRGAMLHKVEAEGPITMIDLSAYADGIYLIKVKGYAPIKIVKQ